MSNAMNQIVPSHNPIQLAAISNYKLAQLTFAPPDLNSLRKTAVIKNMLQRIYLDTPPEWLQQMTRWQYFTPESLEEMTQEGLEEIFAQYAQTIEAFRPIKNTFPFEGLLDDDEDDDEGQGDDLWIADEEIQSIVIQPSEPQQSQSLDSIFSQPNATLSNESIEFPKRSTSPLSEKPLPANPIVNDDTAKQARRKSGFSGSKNRLSWTSDTGITSGVVSQNLANEIMSLFDMDFAIDIKIDTAPKLPELSFKHKRKSQQRKSQDMLTSLIPAFEKIALENSSDTNFEYFPSSVVQPKPTKPNLVIRSVPQRSSSLKHRQEVLASPISPPTTPNENTLVKQKSFIRLASLITVKKKDLPHSPEPSPVIQPSSYFNEITNTPRKTSTSTVDSSSSSSWSYLSDSEKLQKPLPERPHSPDFIPSSDEKVRNLTTTRTISKKKKSVMEKTKRKSLLDEPSQPLSRSKSAFIKIGNGLKTKKQSKQIRRTSSAKDLTDPTPQPLYTGQHFHTVTEVDHIYNSSDEHVSSHSFVKRMASFNWRMKPKHKPVEV